MSDPNQFRSVLEGLIGTVLNLGTYKVVRAFLYQWNRLDIQDRFVDFYTQTKVR